MTIYVGTMVAGFLISAMLRSINLWTGGWQVRVRWAYIADTITYVLFAAWGLYLLVTR